MSAKRAFLFVAILATAWIAGMMTQRLFVAKPTGFPFVASDLPEKRPVFAMADADGIERSSSEWHDKALLVNFWATWCAPCRDEIPLLIELQNKYREAGLQVIGVALESDREAVKQFAAEFAINYPVLVGEQAAIEIAEGFGIEVLALPATAFSRRDGSISTIHLGILDSKDATKALADIF